MRRRLFTAPSTDLWQQGRAWSEYFEHASFLPSITYHSRKAPTRYQNKTKASRCRPTIQTRYYFQSVLWCGSCGEVQVPPQKEDTTDARVQSPKNHNPTQQLYIYASPCSITQGALRAPISTSRDTTSCAVSFISVGLLYLEERIYLKTTCIQRKADALWPHNCY